MISLILPYWERWDAACKALLSIAKAYRGMELEIVVVDDGSKGQPFNPPCIGFPEGMTLKVVTLPFKDGPKSCVTPWNEGVKAASGDVVVLSCVEVLHEQPVLAELVDEVRRLGAKGYALAAAWCPEEDRWHCHSTAEVPQCPKGFGLSFCAAIHRDFYLEIGGFDEAYREGAGYEDRDFIHKLSKFGAHPVIRDDLVVVHPKSGATIAWPPEKFQRNKALFEYKWLHRPVNFVCVKHGKAFGPEYVNILHDMVRRNLPLGFPGRFYCFTDDPTGIDERIECRSLPPDLEKWWGKLYLFKRHLFLDGSRVVFLDLDTAIVGGLEEIVKYDGQFATLNDFYFPDRVGPAIMLWEAGEYTASIWDEWVAQGKPRHPMGDLWWINLLEQGRFAKRADKLQARYPGAFVSFKAGCNPYPPKGTKVVCFHGKPRPHECEVQWVQDVWKIGGGGISDFEIVGNTEAEKVMANVRSAIARDLSWLDKVPEHGGQAVIVGGGPSVASNLDEIRRRQADGQIVIALNGAAHYLKRNGILPDWQVILDARPQCASFVLPEVPRHFICSQCDPSVFDRLAGRAVTLYHVNTQATIAVLAGGRQAHLISTGSTVGMISMGIAFVEGFRIEHLYGMDSSYTDDRHVYEQKLNDSDQVVEASAGGRTFKCAPWMIAQVNEFQEVAVQLADAGCTITVAGDGLLPHVARLMSQPQEITT